MSGHRPWSEVKAERQARLDAESQARLRTLVDALDAQLQLDAASGGARLRDVLGIPPGIGFTFAPGPLAANDAANPRDEPEAPE